MLVEVRPNFGSFRGQHNALGRMVVSSPRRLLSRLILLAAFKVPASSATTSGCRAPTNSVVPTLTDQTRIARVEGRRWALFGSCFQGSTFYPCDDRVVGAPSGFKMISVWVWEFLGPLFELYF